MADLAFLHEPTGLVVACAGLFAVSFAAATVLPLQSEAALMTLLLAGYPPGLLLAVASLGNVLGSLVNWGIGRGIDRFGLSRWSPVDGRALERAQAWYRRFGRWALLLSWLPIVGDPITLVAGMLRESLAVFLVLVGLAKTARYLVLMAGVQAL